MPPKPGTPRGQDHAGTWRKLSSGTWNLSGRYQGIRYSVTASKKDEARKLQRQKIDAIRSGAAQEAARRQTLAGFLDAYLTRKKGRVDPATYASYQLAVAHLNEGFGPVPVKALEPQVIQDAYDVLARRLAPATLRRAHLTLKQALRYAAEEGRAVPIVPKHVRPPRGITEPARAIPRAQLRAFLTAAESDLDWHALFSLAVYSGLRVGELLALRWEDVTSRSVAVRQALGEDDDGNPRIRPYPKTAAGVRTVPIPREVTSLLEARKGKPPDFAAGGHSKYSESLVFAGRGGRPMLKSSVGHAFQRIWTAAGLPGHAHPHLLRHTYAKSQFDLGTPLPLIAARMGHANPSISLSLYAHFARDEQAEEPRALVAYYMESA